MCNAHWSLLTYWNWPTKWWWKMAKIKDASNCNTVKHGVSPTMTNCLFCVPTMWLEEILVDLVRHDCNLTEYYLRLDPKVLQKPRFTETLWVKDHFIILTPSTWIYLFHNSFQSIQFCTSTCSSHADLHSSHCWNTDAWYSSQQLCNGEIMGHRFIFLYIVKTTVTKIGKV